VSKQQERSGASAFIIASVLILAIVVILAVTFREDKNVAPTLGAMTNSDVATPSTAMPTPTLIIHNKRHILQNASPDEVGQYIIREFVPGDLDPRGPVQLLLARPVTRSEITQLGLGCMQNFGSIEDPPLMLIILRGDFADRAGPRPEGSPIEDRYNYAAYTVDIWAAWPARLTLSHTGGFFRTALNDASLPTEGPSPPTECPPRTPGTLPHGTELRGIVFPTPPPGEPTATFEPVPPAVPTSRP
jgi:hypothetical protein